MHCLRHPHAHAPSHRDHLFPEVFRENLAPGQKEFSLKEFKKIVPLKNVSAMSSAICFVFMRLMARMNVN